MINLIVISNEQPVAQETAIIQQLFEAGLHCFHLRRPFATEKDIRQLLLAIDTSYYSRIALHGFHHLAKELGMQRLHFTAQYRQATPATALARLKAEGFILSTSVHSVEELAALPEAFAYTFFSPVFDSISKMNYQGVVKEGFCLTHEQKKLPVIALGGINIENIHQLAAMNFDGAAVLGAIWQEPDNAVEVFGQLIRKQPMVTSR